MAEIFSFPETVTIDRKRMHELAEMIATTVSADLETFNPDTVGTCLSALAIVVARILDATDNNRVMVKLFEDTCVANRNARQ